MKTEVFDLLDLDAWGNEEEGWEVNRSFKIGYLELTLEQWEEDDYIIDELINKGWLTKESREWVEFDTFYSEYSLTLFDSRNGCPVYELRKQ
jgi:hypothetical protein